MTPLDRNDLIERDLQNHAKTLSELTTRMGGYEKEQAVQEVKDVYLREEIDAVNQKLSSIYKLGFWLLAAFGGTFVATVANFVLKGGLFLAK